MTRIHALPVLLLVGLLAASVPASAIYVIQPLRLSLSHGHAEVGDTIDLTIAPEEMDDGPSYADQTVTLRYAFDPHEGRGENAERIETVIATLTLVGENGTYRWTLPAEVDDHNLWISALSEKGEEIAGAPLNVGDAEPIMYALRSGAAEPEPEPAAPEDPAPAAPAEPPAVDAEPQDVDAAKSVVPGIGLGALLAVAGVAAFVVARRR